MNPKEYRELIKKRREARNGSGAINLQMPSGAGWQVLPISLDAYLVSGKLPMHLLQKLESVKDLKVATKVITENITGDEIVKMYELVRDAMLNNVISPRISLEPSDDTLLPEEIDPEDFEFFRDYILSGGQASVNSFRKPTRKKRKRAS
jgi:hypothetical protein